MRIIFLKLFITRPYEFVFMVKMEVDFMAQWQPSTFTPVKLQMPLLTQHPCLLQQLLNH